MRAIRGPVRFARAVAGVLLVLGGAGAVRATSSITIQLSDGVSIVRAGDTVNYRIELSHAGTPGSYVTAYSHSSPTMSCTWTCTGHRGTVCTRDSGTGHLAEGVQLTAGGGATFIATCVAPAQAPGGSLHFQASFSPASFGLPYADDYNRLDAPSDLKVVAQLLPATVAPGQMTQVRFDLGNEGPNGTHGMFSASVPFTPWWSCTPAGGALCPLGWPGTGAVANQLVFLPAGASIVFEATSAAPSNAAGPYAVTSLLHSPGGDPVAGNNVTDDTLRVTGPYVDFGLTPTAVPPRLGAGLPFSYRVRAFNDGTVSASGTVQIGVSSGSVTSGSCVATSRDAVCTPTGAGSFNVTLPASGHADLLVSGTVAALPDGCADERVRLHGSIATGTSPDPVPLNDSAEVYVPCPLFHDSFDTPPP